MRSSGWSQISLIQHCFSKICSILRFSRFSLFPMSIENMYLFAFEWNSASFYDSRYFTYLTFRCKCIDIFYIVHTRVNSLLEVSRTNRTGVPNVLKSSMLMKKNRNWVAISNDYVINYLIKRKPNLWVKWLAKKKTLNVARGQF